MTQASFYNDARTLGVIREVIAERVGQQLKGYDDHHDDAHGPWHLFSEIARRYAAMVDLKRQGITDRNVWRKTLLVIAALAVAGVEAIDRERA